VNCAPRLLTSSTIGPACLCSVISSVESHLCHSVDVFGPDRAAQRTFFMRRLESKKEEKKKCQRQNVTVDATPDRSVISKGGGLLCSFVVCLRSKRMRIGLPIMVPWTSSRSSRVRNCGFDGGLERFPLFASVWVSCQCAIKRMARWIAWIRALITLHSPRVA
jgi:hypothetical protein